MKQRIIGINVAKALAIIGMIIVNFNVVFSKNGYSWVKSFASIFDGKSTATLAMLAVFGPALMTNSDIKNHDQTKLKVARIRIMKRAVFLFFVGLSYMTI
jgi:hypothetical protein